MKRTPFTLFVLVVATAFLFSLSAVKADDGDFTFTRKELSDLSKDMKSVFDAMQSGDRAKEANASNSFIAKMKAISDRKKIKDLLKYPDEIYRIKELTIDTKDRIIKSKAGQGFQLNLYVDKTDQDRNYSYYISIPKGYKPTAEKRFPVLLYLHSPAKGRDKRSILKSVKNELEMVFYDKKFLEKGIIIAPVGPEGVYRKKLADAAEDWEDLDPGRKTAFIAVRVFLEKMVFDRGRVIVFGFGRNGLSAFHYATWYPSLFSGALAVDAPVEPLFMSNTIGMHFSYVSTAANKEENAKKAAAFAKQFSGGEGLDVTFVADSGKADRKTLLTPKGMEALKAILDAPSRTTSPKKVVLKSIDLAYSANAWLQIQVMNNSDKMKVGDKDVPFVEATVDRESDTFNIKTNRVGKFRLYLNDKLVDMDRKITVIVNGKKRWEGTKERNPLLMLRMLFENWAGDYEVYTNYIDIELADY